MHAQISFPFKSFSLDNSVQDQLVKARRKKLLWMKFVRKFERDFQIDHHEQVISYQAVKTKLCGLKRQKVKQISFLDIVSTRKGWSTDTFHKIKNKSDDEVLTDPHKCFSIILDNFKHGKHTLDLACRDRETRDKWHQEVRNIVRELKERREQNTHRTFIGELFKSADKDDKGFWIRTNLQKCWQRLK